jgi:hypothetical protein
LQRQENDGRYAGEDQTKSNDPDQAGKASSDGLIVINAQNWIVRFGPLHCYTFCDQKH